MPARSRRLRSGKSLLPAGVIRVDGSFRARRRGGHPRARRRRDRPRPGRLRRRGRRQDQGPLVGGHSRRSSDLAAAARWCTGTIWWCGSALSRDHDSVNRRCPRSCAGTMDTCRKRTSRHDGARRDELRNCPASPAGHPMRCRYHDCKQKKTPAPEGPGSFAGWVRGWGLGARHPALTIQRRSARAVPGDEIIFAATARRRGRRRERVRSATSAGSSTWRPSGNSRYRKWMRRRPSPPPRPSIT